MNVEIAQRLADMRRQKGYSQEELASNLGLSRQAVSKWERAESSPDTGNLVALAKLYDITLDELLSVEADIEDDVKFEANDRSTSAEVKAQEAAEKASVAAAQAAAAAAQAQAAQAAAQVTQNQQAAAQTAQSHQAASAPAEGQGGAYYPQGASSSHAQAQPVPPAAPAQPGPVTYVVEGKEKKGPWRSFPYPILCVILFFALGFFFGAWSFSWVVFLTIPLYYWIARIIENDPNYRK